MIKKLLQKIFKKISYRLFLNLYGSIDKAIEIKDSNEKRIKLSNVKINNYNYKVYEVTGGRLYTDRIYDTAIILDNNIIDGPSFQLRNHNNSKINENTVFKKGTPRILKKFKGKVLSLLSGGGGNNNYMHWMYDVLPRLELCQKIIKIENIDHVLLPSVKQKFQQETIEKLKIPKHKILSSEKYRHIKAEQLIIADHPYRINNDAYNDELNMPDWIFNWLKEKFIEKSNLVEKNIPKKIYIDKSDSISNTAKLKKITNEKEVIEMLKKKGFETVRLADLKFIEQVKIFNQATSIVGLHGAGFANLAFCKPKTKVLEFRTAKTGKLYENISKKNELNYNSIICEPHSYNLGVQLGHIKISLEELEKKLN